MGRAWDALQHSLEASLEAPFARGAVGAAVGATAPARAETISVFDVEIGGAVSAPGAGERQRPNTGVTRRPERRSFWRWRGGRKHRGRREGFA